MKLIPLSEYAKLHNVTRQRAYQLKSKLNIVTLALYADYNGIQIPIMKAGKPLKQDFVII